MSLLNRLPALLALLATALAAVSLLAALVVVPRGAGAHDRALGGGVLRVGVAWLPPPDTPDMRIYREEGFELDLAADMAASLGTGLNLVRIAPDAAAAALEAGTVDVVITRAGADDPLLRRARVVETGFRSGLSLVMRSDRPLASWSDLKGKVVCASEANGHARAVAAGLGAQVRSERAPALALMHVRTGDCDAAIHDRALLDPLFAKMSWQKFSATLPPVEPTALVVAVARTNAALSRAVAEALDPAASREAWRQRQEKWASTVSFEVYRDQVAADCH